MALGFRTLFSAPKPIIGMIHLAGSERKDRVKRAMEELVIYQEEGVDGAIIEDYHGDKEDVFEALKQSERSGLAIVRGVNVLRDSYSAFALAGAFEANFIQFDSVQTRDLNLKVYNWARGLNPKARVLGGVRFKYTRDTGNPLEQDLREATSRCEAIVTTGTGTGIETPLDKLREFKRYLGAFPLVVGAGVTAENAYAQLSIADAAIVGSYFKGGNTELPVDWARVRELMEIVRQLRRDIEPKI